MPLDRIEMLLLRLPYVRFFETSFGRETDRTFIIVKASAGGLTGFGEVVASQKPLYSYETTETAWHVLKDFFIPLVLDSGLDDPAGFDRGVSRFRGHPMAKAGLGLALWDLEAKKRELPLWKVYGGGRSEIPAGVSVGIQDSPDELLERIGEFLDQGYQRIKIKIKPGWDIGMCETVRGRFPDILLQVDANGAYTLDDRKTLTSLDRFGLLMLEQPFPPYDLWDHRLLQRRMRTPLCLDESITSLTTARQAQEMGSCRVINIKVGRVGGIGEARRIHDFCMDRDIPVWCGGMLESGIGRAHNIHLATLPNFRLPHDISASRRYYAEDIIDPAIEVSPRGTIAVPQGPGIGVSPLDSRIEKAALRRQVFQRKSCGRTGSPS